jgi:hypothetical protein
MRILFSTKLFTLFLLFAAIQVNAQSQSMSLDRLQSIKVNELSDQQITQAWNKIQELGVTEQEAYKLLEERGMDPIEVNLFKQRVGILGLNRKGTNLGSIQKKNDIDYSRDTLNVVSKPLIIPNLNKTNIFGSDFFNQSNLKFDPNFMKVMNLTAIKLAESIQGAQCLFLQSDEISILLHDYKSLASDAWFDYNKSKFAISTTFPRTAINSGISLRYIIGN